VYAYRSLLAEYSRRGSRWISAPKPRLMDRSFAPISQPEPHEPLLLRAGEKFRNPLTEMEPLFDAADFMRCGRDIFYIRSVLTNQFGIDWLQRHLGPGFRFHEIEVIDRRPAHIDTTFLPLAPGKAMVNPDFVPRLPPVLKSWDILYPPPPVSMKTPSPFQFGSPWLNINVFSLDEERVFVDAQQKALIVKLKDWGFRPIAIPFQHYYGFGGGFHCSTLDIRRRGDLRSYF
jgi:glycine amidinotransferase